ncbi:MAG TPA: MFS transporter [Gaiellaceae bacterium]|nr:MFS transporter [Gaiellaceae bacterium]
MRASELLGALRERDFRLLWAGQTTSMLGNALVPVALAFAVLDLTGSATDLGLVLAAQTLPLVLFLLAGGVWADRLPRQLVMVASDVIRGSVHVTIALLLVTGKAEVWHLAALMALFGTAEAFFQPAYTGVVPRTVSPERLQQANALLGMSNGAVLMAGPAIAGILVAIVGPWLAFAFDAVTFAVSAGCLLALSLPRTIDRGARTSFLAELREGWDELLSHTWLWTIIAWAGTYLFFVVAPFYVLGPLVAKEELGGATAWAAIASAWAAGSLAGGAVALRWRPARPMLVCCTLVLWEVVPVSLLALAAPAWLIAPAQAVGGVVMGFFMALWATTLQQHVPAEKLSRVSAYDWLGSLGLMPLGFVLAGPTADAIGVSTTLWISVAWVVISTTGILLVRDVRTLRRADLREGGARSVAVEAA